MPLCMAVHYLRALKASITAPEEYQSFLVQRDRSRSSLRGNHRNAPCTTLESSYRNQQQTHCKEKPHDGQDLYDSGLLYAPLQRGVQGTGSGTGGTDRSGGDGEL